jgi:MFS family permease
MSDVHAPSVASVAAVDRPSVPWYRTITSVQWRVLAAAKLGWMLDAMDFMLYAMAIGQLRTYFAIDDATAGLLGTVTLAMSACGGILFGFIADRIGRARALMATIVVFSLASLGAATSQTIVQLLMWRALLGIGMGGEWGSGAVLVSETWPPMHRNKAISIMQSGWALGYILAAVVAGIFIDTLGLGDEAWRWLFAFGAVPALFVLWVRRSVPEPAVWSERRHESGRRVNPFAVIFGGEFRRRTLLIIALNSATQFGYWGIFFWLPGFLSPARWSKAVPA